MKVLTLAAALAAGSAMAAGDVEIELVNEALNATPCATLVRLVVEADPRGEAERRLRTAAMGLLIGQALGPRDIANLYPNIKAGQERLVAGCDGRPDRTWISIIADRTLD